MVEVETGAADEPPSLEVVVEGEPSLTLSLSGGSTDEAALATLAVNAIPAVLTSDPGLYTLAELPPVHCWTSLGLMPANLDEYEDDE